MPKHLHRKAMLGFGFVVIAAMVAIIVTMVASTATIQALQESQEFRRVMLTAADDMDLDTVSAALKVYQYLETGDPHFRTAYREHGVRFNQYAERFQSLARFREWQETGKLVAAYYHELDEVSQDVMAKRDQTLADASEVDHLLQQLIAASGSAPATPNALPDKIAARVHALRLALSDRASKQGNAATVHLEALRALHAAQTTPAATRAGVPAATAFERGFDALLPAIEQLLKSSQAGSNGVARMLELQQLITATRVRSALTQHAEAAVGTAEGGIRRLLTIAAITFVLLMLLALLAGRYVRQAIVQASA